MDPRITSTDRALGLTKYLERYYRDQAERRRSVELANLSTNDIAEIGRSYVMWAITAHLDNLEATR